MMLLQKKLSNIKYVILLFSSILMVSCSDSEIDLVEEFKMERERFLGSWEVIGHTTHTRNDTLIIEFDREMLVDISMSIMTIENLSNGQVVEYNWYYQIEPEQIVRIQNTQGGILSNSYIHSVLKVEEDEMIWLYEYKFENDHGITNVSSEWTLSKI